MMAAVLLPARTISRPRCAAATTTRAAARADAALARSSATLPLPSPDSARSSALSSSMKATSWSILAAALVVASASGRLLGRGACVRGGAEEDSMCPPPAPRSRTLFRSSLIHCSCWSPCPEEEDMGKPRRGRRQYKHHDGGKWCLCSTGDGKKTQGEPGHSAQDVRSSPWACRPFKLSFKPPPAGPALVCECVCVSVSVSQSVISRSHPALTPPPAVRLSIRLRRSRSTTSTECTRSRGLLNCRK